MPLRRILFVAATILAGPAGAAELGFAHFAPGAGTVRLQVDALPAHVLAYKDYDAVTSHPAGLRHLSATAADGSVLAEGTLELAQDDRYVVMLAGNGTPQAPWQLRLATDHNHAFILEQSSLQEASLAIFVPDGGNALASLVVRNSCDGSQARGTTEAFGYGTRTFDGRPWTGGVSIRNDRQACVQTAETPAGDKVAEATIAARRGERLRRFLIGDGVHAPYEMVVVSQGIEAIRPLMTPDASIEGLYAIEGAPNTGLQVAFDAFASPSKQISAVYFGFENDGRAAWRTIENVRLVEYVGGNIEGTRAAVGFERAHAFIAMHSCTELTMKVVMQTGLPEGRIFPGEPRNTLYLKRLFPPACPPADGSMQEGAP